MGFLGNANGTGVIIGIIDTGIQLNHAQYLNAQGVSRVLPGACFAGMSGTLCSTSDNRLGGDDAVWPTITHGTHVAGIAAGLTTGLASNAQILPVRVCDSATGQCPGDIDGGIVWASTHGAKIINLSLGGSFLFPNDIAAARTAVSNGALLVVAAGNAGNSTPVNGFLGGAALLDGIRGSMLVVGGVNSSGVIASWSQTPGNTCAAGTGGTYCMMNYFVVAPGVHIISSVGGGGYASLGGTSMATPYVSGVAADIKSMWPYLTMPQVASVILGTTIDLGAPGPDPIYGMGEVNIAKALLPSGTTSVVTGGSNVVTTTSLAPNASSAQLNGVLSAGIAGSSLLKKAVVVDRFNRAYTADLTLGVRNLGFDPATFVMLDNTLEAVASPGSVQSGLKAVANEGYSPELGVVSMSGLVNTETTPAIFATTPSARDLVRGYVTNMAVSATPFDGVSFDMGYKLRLSGRINQYDASASPIYSGLFFSASAVNSPYASLADGGNYAGASVELADGLNVRTGYTWLSTSREPSGLSQPHDLMTNSNPNAFGEVEGRGARTALAAVSWRFADWGGLGIVASQTNESNGILGGFGVGALNLARSADTSALEASMRIGLGHHWIATLAYGEGVTNLNDRTAGLLSDTSALRSRSYGVAVATRDLLSDGDTFGVALTRPMYVYNGSGVLSAATDVDNVGNLTIGHQRANFAEANPESDVEIGYSRPFFGGAMSLQGNAAYQLNVGGQQGRNAVAITTRLKIGL